MSNVAARRNRLLIYGAAFFRSTAVSMLAVILAIYLTRLAFSISQIGILVSIGLIGATVAVFVVTIMGDKFNKSRQLVLLAVLSAFGGIALAQVQQYFVIALAAFFGMLNGMGRDRGAMLVLEQAILPSTTTDEERTKTFAWYNVTQDVGHALGGLLAGIPALLERFHVIKGQDAYVIVIYAYAVSMLICAVLYKFLTPAIELTEAKSFSASPETRNVLTKICTLFAVDSFGGGFLTTALISLFFFQRFEVSVETIALLFFTARFLNAVSHVGAAILAHKIGLVNTMVFTHIPSSFLLLTIPFVPNFEIAALLFLIREGLVEMDVPTRQSYVMAMVPPEARTVASGATHLTRLAGWAIAPMFAGLLMDNKDPALPLMVGAGLKITYDILLYRSFHKLKPPEERLEDPIE